MADHSTSGVNTYGTIAVVVFNLISAASKSDLLFILSVILSIVGIIAHATTIKKNTQK